MLFQISDDNESCDVKQLFRRRRKWNAGRRMNLSNTCRIFADLLATLPLCEERDAAIRAERFAMELLREHDASGHDGKRCPFATRI